MGMVTLHPGDLAGMQTGPQVALTPRSSDISLVLLQLTAALRL